MINVLNNRSKTGWCKGIYYSSLAVKLCFVSSIVPYIALRLCPRETMFLYDEGRSENVYCTYILGCCVSSFNENR